ncbi:MAG: YgiT-type zinc finger protein [Chloroflexi bacterium]|nr:YgiT-type zinc finger protein [Chloroflexota bacterium]
MECPRCKKLTYPGVVRTNVWQGDERLIIVEDIPAQLCEQCGEQYYDPLTSETLRALVEDLNSATPKRVMEVPVYSLEGRIPELHEPLPGEPEQEVEGEY